MKRSLNMPGSVSKLCSSSHCCISYLGGPVILGLIVVRCHVDCGLQMCAVVDSRLTRVGLCINYDDTPIHDLKAKNHLVNTDISSCNGLFVLIQLYSAVVATTVEVRLRSRIPAACPMLRWHSASFCILPPAKDNGNLFVYRENVSLMI